MSFQKITPVALKALRTLKGVSQAALAREVGLQRSYISQFETGKYLMTDAEIDAVTDYLSSLNDVNEKVPQESPEALWEARVVDGLLVPGGLSGDKLEALIEALRDAQDELVIASNINAPRGFFGGVDQAELDRLRSRAGIIALKVVHLMSAIQGRELFDLEHGIVSEALLEQVGVLQEE
jgi:transcriptional regulator with XRE-family HTH domain